MLYTKTNYADLIEDTPYVLSEEKSNYSLITERHVQAMWLEQKYFRSLKTTSGEPVTVVSPGIWNSEAGPDFLKAHIRIGDTSMRGDIELHLNDEGWTQHAHHIDPRYNDVVLHLSLWNPHKARSITTCDGRDIAMAHLEEHLTIPLTRVVNLIDLDLYPYRRFVGSGRCSKSVFNRMTDDEASGFFHSAALWRLRQKHRHLAATSTDTRWQYAGGIAQALGYKHNSRPFLELFSELLVLRDLPEEQLLAIGMGACGFFEERFVARWGASQRYQHLQDLWWNHQPHVLFQVQLRLDHIRPLNHPVRRLAYLAKLISDGATARLENGLIDAWRSLWQPDASAKSHRNLLEHLLDTIPSYTDTYWESHYTFELEPRSKAISLMGQPLRREIILNAGLPLLYRDILERSDPHELAAFDSFYRSLRATASSKAEYLRYRLFGEKERGKLLSSASAAQGALQLHHDFCIHYEASCEGCPFVDRMSADTF